MLRAVASQILSGTWANKPSSAPLGGFYFASDVGEYGTLMVGNGTRWRPMNGRTVLKALVGPSAAVNNTETIVAQTLVPAGLIKAGDSFRFTLSMNKSGGTDLGYISVRMGTAGTTGDTGITGLTTYNLMSAGAVSCGGIYEVAMESVTSARKVGANSAQQSAMTNTVSSGTLAAATTVSSFTTGAMYVSLSIVSQGATNTVQANTAQIELITP